MFQFTSKARTFAIILMLVGLVSWIAGYVMHNSHHEADANGEHATEQVENHHGDAHAAHGDGHHDAHHAEEAHGGGVDHETQMHNRPWSALFVNSFFFLAIGLGALFFLAIQYAAQAGWSIGLTRVMEASALFMPVPLIVIIIIAILGQMHVHHIWHWMDPELYIEGGEHYDSIIAGKQGYLNFPFFIIRAIIYLVGWTLAAIWLRKNSKLEDANGGFDYFRKNVRVSAIFLVFFAVTSSTAAWDFVMSIDTHWFSTLFGWYTFAGIFVTAITALTMLVVYLKSQGYMEWINENHLQDLGKFMFAFSVFWTYLWFSQFMLIWYSNIPEEVTYYMQRFGEYKLWFFIMLALNFALPVLLVMSRDAKRVSGLLIFTGVFVLAGHWLDHYIMIMPGSVGSHYGLGLLEIGPFLFFFGAYIMVVFSSLAKAPLKQANHPMIHESKYFHQ